MKFLFSRVIDKLEAEKWNTFSTPEDWFSASDIDLGDLGDDLYELKKLIVAEERFCTYVDFDRLASLLREISQVENPV